MPYFFHLFIIFCYTVYQFILLFLLIISCHFLLFIHNSYSLYSLSIATIHFIDFTYYSHQFSHLIYSLNSLNFLSYYLSHVRFSLSIFSTLFLSHYLHISINSKLYLTTVLSIKLSYEYV